MAVVSMSYLLEAGVHFGHQTKRWNPKMKEYIFTAREDIYIIDLQKTQELLEVSYNEIKTIAANGGKFLFVGTKKQAQEVCVEEANRSKSYYVTERWLGGTLTNFRTIRRRVRRLEEIVTEYEIDTFVIGMPLKMDGSKGDSVMMVEKFVEELKKHITAEVVFQDERLSTVSAERILIESNMRREKRKDYIDSVAATIILQNYLDKIKK